MFYNIYQYFICLIIKYILILFLHHFRAFFKKTTCRIYNIVSFSIQFIYIYICNKNNNNIIIISIVINYCYFNIVILLFYTHTRTAVTQKTNYYFYNDKHLSAYLVNYEI